MKARSVTDRGPLDQHLVPGPARAYANQPAMWIAPTATGAGGPVTAGSWTSVKVPSVVKGNGTYSFVLKTTGVTALALASREDSAHMPQLVIKTQ